MTANITPQHFDQFFTPLVGSPEAIEGFSAQLGNGVAAIHNRDILANEPYDQIFENAGEALQKAVTTTNLDIETRNRIVSTALVSTHLILDTLRALGWIYAAKAKEPQELRGMCSNVRRIVDEVTHLAYGDQMTGLANRYAWCWGIEPQGMIINKIISTDSDETFVALQQGNISTDSFVTTTDESGQLDIRPRFPRRKSPVGNKDKCPAIVSKVQTPEGIRPAVTMFGRVLGLTAITEIYGRIVPIVDTPAVCPYAMSASQS